MFKPSNLLARSLQEEPRDLNAIVGALMGYVNADQYFLTDDFDKAVDYVLSTGVSKEELFQTFDTSIEYEENSNKWDEDYQITAIIALRDNFCEKRINHLKEVSRKIYKLNHKLENATTSEDYKEKKNFSKRGILTICGLVGVALLVLMIILIVSTSMSKSNK